MRGVGLQGRFPSRLRVGVLIDYLVIQGRSDPIPTPLEASCSLAQQVVLSRTVWIWSARPTLSGRVRFGPPHGYPGVTSPTTAVSAWTGFIKYWSMVYHGPK